MLSTATLATRARATTAASATTATATTTTTTTSLVVRRTLARQAFDLAPLLTRLDGKHYVGGELRAPTSNEHFDARSPATGEHIARVPASSVADVDAAVADAKEVHATWAAMPVRERGKALQRIASSLQEHVEEFAQLTALETGKAIRTESRVEANILADVFAFFGGLGGEIKGETIPWNPSSLTYTVRESHGVVGAIVPWNAPLMLAALKIAPALLCGNTVVVKPAEPASLVLTRMSELCGAHLPAGVLACPTGLGAVAGARLAAHPDVAKVTFTGSVATGRAVYHAQVDKLSACTLELGGKSPMVVCADANVDKAVEGAYAGMRFTRTGQSCTASSRIFVHSSVYEEFRDKLIARVNVLKMGDPRDEDTDMGTVITRAQRDKILGYIESGRSHSPSVKAHVLSSLPQDDSLKEGNWVQPVIFEHLPNTSRVCREEIFGPVTALLRFDSLDDALAAANDSEYGLAASIWTKSLATAMRGVNELQAGTVQVNQNVVMNPNFPCGGWKTSGLGREAALEDMLDSFTRKKTVSLNLTE